MHPFPFTDPPTASSLQDARRDLENSSSAVDSLSRKIEDAELHLARIIQEHRQTISQLESERAELERRVAHTLYYLSPIRRLPQELLAEVFLYNFEEYPCCAWVLASVCTHWRRLALSMPRLWSKIRLVTSQDAAPDTIRLWLERSGSTIPLDIEIFLRSPTSPPSVFGRPRGGRRTSSGTIMVTDTFGDWTVPIQVAPVPAYLQTGTMAQLVQQLDAQLDSPPLPTGTLFGDNAPDIFPPGYQQGGGGGGGAPERPSTVASAQQAKTRSNTHWGYIAFYYLAEQMHRWERFVFRFDKQFASIAAFKSFAGDAPLLREFEVSCADPHSAYGEWTWLPSSKPGSHYNLDRLQALTLTYVPFKCSSPMLKNLRSLSLRAVHGMAVSTDRLLRMITASPTLESLSLHFTQVHSAVLPLQMTTLHHLKELSMGGTHTLGSLFASLSLPSLKVLNLDIETRDAIDDMITHLLARSGNPAISHLSLAYESNSPSIGLYHSSSVNVSSWHFLSGLEHLETLQVGNAPFETLLTSLTIPEDDGQGERWLCPNMTTLVLRSCHTHSDSGASRIVRLVDARNPDPAGGNTPVSVGGTVPEKLRRLEVHNCVTLGPDVVAWLKRRIDEVACTEPAYDRYARRSL
ncbi:hypothetical protein K474DRAFT_1605776 [Panus rudis PR-1116 ss-1]|nr:hypothetical protein K474DRAFT_1605776 [Panus rudis PR-1116 ss-1]